MAEVVSMPKLGFDMAEGTLVRWVIAEGEEVAKGAVLAEIETDKATVEVESSFGGTVLRHLVKEGTPVPVGDAIAVIGEAGEDVDVEALTGEALTGEAPAGGAGETGETAEAGAPQEKVEEVPAKQEAVPAAPTQEEAGTQFPDGMRASPLARKIAEDQGIDLREVKGSGPQGRIVKKDVEAYQPAAQPAAAAEQAPAAAKVEKKTAVALPEFSPVGPPPPDERIALNRLRAAIGRRMKEAKQQVPHFYVTSEYNMEPVMQMRKQINEMLPEGEKLSVNDFIIKAAALTLRQFPNLNASLDGDAVIRRGQVNIGVAVAVEGGLLTVVSRDTDRKSLRQISAEVRSMVARARSGKVRPDDIEGSTFSVSNLGMYDVEHFIAIINPPEAGILAVGSAREIPVVRDGEVVPGMMMKATISVDHRVSDGAEAAQFMQALAAYLHEPLRLLV
jgi:pyruvate dehydrogenase E2 component (dihydrolipoamide acetyltransferase)